MARRPLTTRIELAGSSTRRLPWWTWIVPLVVSQLATRASLGFQFSPGVAILYLPIPLGIAMIQWWGPRVLLGVYLNAVLSAGLWGLSNVALWPVYAVPETLAVLSSWLLFTRLAHGRPWLPELRDSILFVVLAIVPAACFDGFQVTGQLVLLGDLPASEFWGAAWGEWTGTMLSGFAVALPLLVLLTPLLERRGWSTTTGAEPIRFAPEGADRSRFAAEVAIVLGIPLVLALVVPVGAYWFIFAIVALWMALRFGLGMAMLTNSWIVFLTLVVPAVVMGVSGSPFTPREDLTTIRIGLGVLCGVSIITGSAISTLFQEISARRVTEASLRASVAARIELEEQLRQAAKMDAVGQLAGGVAHDFNNMLTAIRGYAEIVRANPGVQAADIREDLDQIVVTADRASALTRQLLMFARKSVLVPRVVDVADAVASIAPMLRRLLGEHVRLVVLGSSGAGSVLVDPGQLEQVILNLSLNARDAMPDGGTLTIETAGRDAEDDIALPSGMAPVSQVVLTISDTGLGMDEDTRSHIFEPFFTTKEVGQGTGMGLATVWGIVNASGGSIELETEPGRGTTFRLHFPRVDAGIAPATAEPATLETPRGSEVVLIVEDESAVREFARRTLSGLGYAVIDAANGEDALALAHGHRGSIDLLVSDVTMPGMQGPELGRRLVAERPELRVLYVSGFAERLGGPDDPAAGRWSVDVWKPARGVAYLAKPYARDALGRAVRQLLDEGGSETDSHGEIAVGVIEAAR